MDYSKNPLGRKDDGPATIPPHVCLEIGREFQLELEIQQLHGTSRVLCKARVEGFNGTGSWVRILGYGDIVETYRGNKQQVFEQLWQDEPPTSP